MLFPASPELPSQRTGAAFPLCQNPIFAITVQLSLKVFQLLTSANLGKRKGGRPSDTRRVEDVQEWDEEEASGRRAAAAEVRIRDELGSNLILGVLRLALHQCLSRV
ncbi:MAG: hypothetical protein LH610_08840 [Sphingomonas bacterium]|nr:hypothetical protein [Sphingomonas bacterium]